LVTVAVGGFVTAFLVLLVDLFVPVEWLKVMALGWTGAGFLALWGAVLCWRIPVLPRRFIWALTLVWLLGLAIAIALVMFYPTEQVGLARKAAAQWLAFSMSLSFGGLQFRALFHRRATSVVGRILSLLSPIVVVILILVETLHGA
jgi:hypothetical protein